MLREGKRTGSPSEEDTENALEALGAWCHRGHSQVSVLPFTMNSTVPLCTGLYRALKVLTHLRSHWVLTTTPGDTCSLG